MAYYGTHSSQKRSALLCNIAPVIVITACIVIFIVYLTDGDGGKIKSNTNIDNYNSNSARGLYSGADSIIEIDSEQSFRNIVTLNSLPTIVVYYASWCGHCRNFAPKMIALADEVKMVVNSLATANPNNSPNLTFAAVDCVQFHKICSENKVEFYPMLKGYRFNQENKEEIHKLQGIIKDIKNFLSQRIFTHGELTSTIDKLIQPSSPNTNNSTIQNALLTKYKEMRPISHSAISNARNRLHDAMMSLYYLLLYELPEPLTQDKAKILQQFLSIVRQSLPTEEHDTRRVLASVLMVLFKYSKSGVVSIGKIQTIIRNYLMDTTGNNKVESKENINLVTWHICGVTYSQYQQQVNENLTRQWAINTQRHLHSNAENSTSEWSRQLIALEHSDPARGYTCGLWMLLHHLTINNKFQENEAGQSVDAFYGVLRDFLEKFFTCSVCRSHFLNYYDSCIFRDNLDCQGKGTDNNPMLSTESTLSSQQKLQLWLFYAHNLATVRILLEKTLPTNNLRGTAGSILQSSQDLIEVALWPSQAECPLCYSTTSPTISFLQERISSAQSSFPTLSALEHELLVVLVHKYFPTNRISHILHYINDAYTESTSM